MRPRRVILLFDPTDHALRVRGYMFWVHGYRVIGVNTADEAFDALGSNSVHLIVARYRPPVYLAEEFVRSVKLIAPEVPVMLFDPDNSNHVRVDCAEAFVAGVACTPAEILDRVRILIQRKRGPKKRSSAVSAAQPSQVIA
jgi:DNA-binding response OmpR family regulator